MEYHSLFLPLLGGFLFYHLNWVTAHKANNETAQKVLFGSATIGLVLLIVARVIGKFFERPDLENYLGWPLIKIGIFPFILSLELGILAIILLELADLRKRKIFKTLLIVSATLGIAIGVAFALFKPNIPIISDLLLLTESQDVKHLSTIRIALVVTVLLTCWYLSRVALVPLGAMLFKVGVLGLAAVGLLAALSLNQEVVINTWNSLTEPLRDMEASNGIGTAFLACLLGPISALTFNFLYSQRAAAIMAMTNGYASGLDRLIFAAHSRGELLMITMSSGKVYVCRVSWIPPNPRRKETFLNIWPVKSGYRDPVTHAVKLDTDYEHVRKRIDKQHWSRFQKAIRIEDITTVNFFDEKYFTNFTARNTRRAAIKRAHQAETKK